MSDQFLTIREMCETYEVTPRALRFYEAKELLSPMRQGQRRFYARRERARLKLILRGKRFGFSLEEIRQMLDMYDIENGPVHQMAEAIGAARKRLVELQHQRRDLDQTISDLSEQIAVAEAGLEKLSQSAA